VISKPSIFSSAILAAMLALSCVAATDNSPPPSAPPPRPAPEPRVPGKIPYVQLDLKKREVRVECQALRVQLPLEFFCVTLGGPEHETVLRTAAQPSDIHFALLALGLTPGESAHYVDATDTWYAPTGAPLEIDCTFDRDGKTVTVPAYRMMRDLKTKQEMPPITWVFDGSRILPDGHYAADITGYVVSIVNFDMTMIDVPELASNSNETLEWETNPDVSPDKGAAVWMIIHPAQSPLGGATTRAAQTRPGSSFYPGPGLMGGGGSTTRTQ
jgi:hypothetical protein